MQIDTIALGTPFFPLRKGTVTRRLDLPQTTSLFSLGAGILAAYEFDMDHAFGFYDRLNDPWGSTQRFTSLADFLDDSDPQHGGSVKKTTAGALFAKQPEWLFLFDFGDEWRFHLKLVSQNESGKPGVRVIAAKGDAPDQYPDFGDGDDED